MTLWIGAFIAFVAAAHTGNTMNSCVVKLTHSSQAVAVRLHFAGTTRTGQLKRGGGEFDAEPLSLGIDAASLASVGKSIAIEIKRDAGTFSCLATTTGSGAHGSLTFDGNAHYQSELVSAGAARQSLSQYDLMSAAAVDLSVAYVRALASVGYAGYGIDTMLALRVLHINPNFIREITSACPHKVGPKDVENFRVAGITAKYVSDLKNAGYGYVTPRQLLELKAADITPAYIWRLHRLGIHQPTVNELISLKIAGI